jgi:inorganic pyrophosphatase
MLSLKSQLGLATNTRSITTPAKFAWIACSLPQPVFPRLRLREKHTFNDGDPLDALIMLDEPTFPGCVVSCRVIGMFRMTDEKGGDDKLLCVAAGDIRKSNLNDLADVPIYELDEIKHFFEVYKTLEPGKEVHGGDWVGHDAAEEEILASYKRFKDSH